MILLTLFTFLPPYSSVSGTSASFPLYESYHGFTNSYTAHLCVLRYEFIYYTSLLYDMNSYTASLCVLRYGSKFFPMCVLIERYLKANQTIEEAWKKTHQTLVIKMKHKIQAEVHVCR